MQYKVPQNIDMEDKIIGPFTMKQFIYLLISGSIIYGWWSYLQKSYLNFTPAFLAVAIPVGLLGICMAVVKVNDRPFEVFILSLFRFISSPKLRMWQEGYKEEPIIVQDQTNQPVKETQTKDTRSLDDLAKSLEAQSKSLADTQPKPVKAAATAEGAPKPTVNLSVNDTDSAAKKQQGAQKDPAPPTKTAALDRKKGFLGIFGK